MTMAGFLEMNSDSAHPSIPWGCVPPSSPPLPLSSWRDWGAGVNGRGSGVLMWSRQWVGQASRTLRTSDCRSHSAVGSAFTVGAWSLPGGPAAPLHLARSRKTVTLRGSQETSHVRDASRCGERRARRSRGLAPRCAPGRGLGALRDGGLGTAGVHSTGSRGEAGWHLHGLQKRCVPTHRRAFRAARLVRETRAEAATLAAGRPIRPTWTLERPDCISGPSLPPAPPPSTHT